MLSDHLSIIYDVLYNHPVSPERTRALSLTTQLGNALDKIERNLLNDDVKAGE